jgi:hypothetical protein
LASAYCCTYVHSCEASSLLTRAYNSRSSALLLTLKPPILGGCDRYCC